MTVNLAPADLKKQGPAFDLPIAVGILMVDGNEGIDEKMVGESLVVGELALEGVVRPVTGVLSMALLAKEKGLKQIFVPRENAPEAALVQDLEVMPVGNLKEIVDHFAKRGEITPLPNVRAEDLAAGVKSEMDMSHVKGQEHAKRALEVAAAGAHNVLMNGPPGSGKTLLARTFPTILPKMTMGEMLEATKVHSVAGTLPVKEPLVASRPWRAPHHTASSVALVGGGKFPKPGEISLAHRGVLFLDEFAEFPAQVLEVLRQPLEDGIVTVSRAAGSCTFPAKFILIAAMNPCPCGFATDPERECSCSGATILRYQKKISGPLLDRIDLHVEVPRLAFEKMTEMAGGESSVEIQKRVQGARDAQKRRFAGTGVLTNADMGPKDIDRWCVVSDETRELLRRAVNQMQLSGRALHRILKVGRTIADLEGAEEIGMGHVAEALQFRARE